MKSARVRLFSLFTGLLALATVVMPQSSPASAAVFTQEFAVPAYFYPTSIDPYVAHPTAPYSDPAHPEYNYWWSMCSGLANAGGGTVIMNPQGVDRTTSANTDYRSSLVFCQKTHAGVSKNTRVLAYVDTDHGSRSLAAVQADIDNMYAFYHGYTLSAVPQNGIDGIFLDDMYNKSTNVLDPNAAQTYYATIYSYIKGKDAAAVVVGNPRTPDTTDWQISVPVADEINIFEGSAATYASWRPPAWVTTHSQSKFWNLVHSAADANAVNAARTRSYAGNAGNFFASSGNGSWTTFPADNFWQHEYGGVTLRATMDPFMLFTVGNRPTTCNGESDYAPGAANATTISLGRMGLNSNVSAGQALSAATNAANGFSVYVRGSHASTPLRSPGHHWADVAGTYASPAALGSGERFGYTWVDSTASSSTPTAGSAMFARLDATDRKIMGSATTASGTGCISWDVQTSGSTPAGRYSSNIYYTAVPTY